MGTTVSRFLPGSHAAEEPLPDDMAHIVSVAAHEGDEEKDLLSLQETVNALRAKHSIGTPLQSGELEAIRREIDAKRDREESSSDDSSDSDADEPRKKPRRSSAAEDASDSEPEELPKTKNEVAAPIIQPTLKIIPADAPIELLGYVDSIISNVLVISAANQGDTRVLDEGSLICLEDRRVLGAIFETFGSVSKPSYSLRFPSATHPYLKTCKPAITKVFFSPDRRFSTMVFTRELKEQPRGTDASNIYDEEPNDNEVEFSDDEQERLYKAMLKRQRKARRDSHAAEDFDDEDEDMDKPDVAGLEEVEELNYDEAAATDSAKPKSGGEEAASPSSTTSTALPRQGNEQQRGRGRGRGRGQTRGRGGRGGANRNPRRDEDRFARVVPNNNRGRAPPIRGHPRSHPGPSRQSVDHGERYRPYPPSAVAQPSYAPPQHYANYPPTYPQPPTYTVNQSGYRSYTMPAPSPQSATSDWGMAYPASASDANRQSYDAQWSYAAREPGPSSGRY